jgi:hypothetical protein
MILVRGNTYFLIKHISPCSQDETGARPAAVEAAEITSLVSH